MSLGAQTVQNFPRAGSLLADAYAIVQTRSEKIRDPVLRASFCEKVAAHREILTSYQQLAAREDGGTA